MKPELSRADKEGRWAANPDSISPVSLSPDLLLVRANDIDRLKESLARWDELFMNSAPEKMQPVFAILTERVKRHLAQLEEERQQITR